MKINNLLFYCCIPFLIISCQSKEEKVNELIKNEMFRTMYDFESYEPIETIIDSAFTSIYNDSIVLGINYLRKVKMSKAGELIDEVNSLHSTIEIYATGYSSYSRNKARRALNEATEKVNKADLLMADIKSMSREIKQRNDSLIPQFIGWKATHKYRCKNKGGNFDIGNNEYLINHTLDSIISVQDLDDEEFIELKNSLDEIINKIYIDEITFD